MYSLPSPLPGELVVSGKTCKRVGGRASVNRGVCKSNDGGWHYYFNRMVVDAAVADIGNRRYFSVCTAAGRRISMKPQAQQGLRPAKLDEILIWYRFDEQWTGNRTEPVGWGRTVFNGKDADRVAKAVTVLRAFLERTTALAEGPGTPLAPVLTPPISTFTVISEEEAEAAFEASQQKPKVVTASSTTDAPDDWENL